MKVFLTLVVLISALTAQDVVDSLVSTKKILNESQKKLIRQYRLPAWGYNRWTVDFNGSFSDENFENKEQKEYKNFRVNVLPEYKRYFESENVIQSYSVSLNTYLARNKTHRINEDFNQTENLKNLRSLLDFNGYLKKYYRSTFYWELAAKQHFEYNENSNDMTRKSTAQVSKSKVLSINRSLYSGWAIGLGWGRVRNVSPVLRALSFNRLYGLLQKGENFSENEIKELARFFARRYSYFKIYHRPQKYFYFDLPASVRRKIDRLSAWQVMYLNETWQQIIGDRLEGADGSAGILYSYYKKTYSFTPDNSELMLLGVYLNQNYYHNVTMKYQVGVKFYSDFSQALNNNTDYNYFGKTRFTFSNLFNLLDRLLAQFQLEAQTVFARSKLNTKSSVSAWQRVDLFAGRLRLDYFMENNLSFNVIAAYKKYFNRPERLQFYYQDQFYYGNNFKETGDFYLTFGFTYFINRTLL